MPLTQRQLLNSSLETVPDGTVYLYDRATNSLKPVFDRESISPDLYNVLRGSLLMYQTLQSQVSALDALLEICEANHASNIGTILERMQSTMHMVIRISERGREAYRIENK